jgi:hypothetical protein
MVLIHWSGTPLLPEGDKVTLPYKCMMVTESEWLARLEWVCGCGKSGWSCKRCLNGQPSVPKKVKPLRIPVEGAQCPDEQWMDRHFGVKVKTDEVWTALDGSRWPVYRRVKE